jgi:hypothetical protein
LIVLAIILFVLTTEKSGISEFNEPTDEFVVEIINFFSLVCCLFDVSLQNPPNKRSENKPEIRTKRQQTSERKKWKDNKEEDREGRHGIRKREHTPEGFILGRPNMWFSTQLTNATRLSIDTESREV